MNENTEKIIALYDGKHTSVEISKIVGLSPRYVRRIAHSYNLPRLGLGARCGDKNHQFVSGRRIDLDGYVLVSAPHDHPYARFRKNRKTKIMFEHRLIMEQKLGRYLLPTEVVDHIDGLTLHNEPSNLRLFSSNGDHLKETITGVPKRTSKSGIQNIKARFDHSVEKIPVDTYYRRRARGDVRLLQTFLLALSLGTDSPFLLGTHQYLKKAQIDSLSHSTIIHALAQLYQRWEEDLSR